MTSGGDEIEWLSIDIYKKEPRVFSSEDLGQDSIIFGTHLI